MTGVQTCALPIYIGGELDSILADSTESSSIGAAMRELEARCNFECGDTITIEEVETEIE